MAKFGYSSRYENLAKELIYHILEFEEWDENFTASMNYIMSNIMYHHCLDVNSHYVQRSLQGISFKMGIHGHQKKAERLHSLTEQFLSSPVLEDQGDVKWSILSLLIELGQHPARDSLSSSLISEPNIVSDMEMKNAFDSDWIRELMEKSFHFPDKDETLSEWSDDDEMRRSFSLGIEVDQQVRRKSVNQGYRNAKLIEEREKKNFLIKETHLAKSWLSNTIQRPCWDPDTQKLIINTSDNPNKRCGNVLTEYLVMRECIWVLLHPSSGFIFLQDGDEFKTRPFAISSLPKVALQQLLHPMTLAASKLFVIDRWLKDTQLLIIREERKHWGTLQSYSDGLRKWRNTFNLKVNSLENEIFGQEGTSTLLWLLNELEPYLSNLSAIYNVHCKAFNFPQEPLLKRTFKLLSLLVQSVESGVRGADRGCLLVLLKFALKNHLMSLYSLLWGTNPCIETLLQEFGIVKRNVNTKPEKLKKNFTLDETDYMNLPGLDFLRTLRSPLMEICELKEIVKDLEISSEFEPDYLENLIETQMWNKFHSKSNDYSSEQLNIRGTSLFKSFLEENAKNESQNKEDKDECKRIESRNTNEEGDCNRSENMRNESEGNESTQVGNIEENEGSNDIIINVENAAETNILKFYIEDLYLEKAFEVDELMQWQNQEHTNSFECQNLEDSKGLELLLTNTLLPVVQERYLQLAKILMNSLIETHGLKRQMRIFISIVLLSSTNMMSEFYSYLFHKIDSKEPVEENDLTQNLQYCISLSHPKLAQRFGISLKGSEVGKFSTICSTDVFSSFSIDFTDLWPLSIVLSDCVLQKYNKIFVFCLMLKRAAFTLERLHFKEIASFNACYSRCEIGESSLLFNEGTSNSRPLEVVSESLPLPQRIHRLQLLRQWLLYFARVLHDHLNTAVLVPFSQQVEELLDKEHFADFMNEHEKLLNNVCHQCLLNEEKHSPIQTALSQVFSTVEKVRELWTGSPDRITEKELDSLEDQYSTCHRFMANFLSTLAHTRFCPLVEGLAQSLTYNCPS